MSVSAATIIIWIVLGLTPINKILPVTSSIIENQDDDRININRASNEELERLPGIGPALASHIIEHREKHGPFKRPQDIIIVRGMSAKLFRRIERLIRI